MSLTLVECGFPPRAIATQEKQKLDGPWYDTGQVIWRLMGSGMLIALLGKSGTGKTLIAANLGRQLIAKGGRPQYWKAMEIFTALKDSFRSVSQVDTRTVIQDVGAPEFLVIDEIDKRGETAWEDRVLQHIIDMRYDHMKDTLLIGNCTKEALEESLGAALISRMNETGGIITCEWPSFRELER